MWICYGAISEHSEYNINFTLAYAQLPLQEMLRDGRKLHPAEPSCLGKQKTQTPFIAPATSIHCVRNHTHPHLL